jgi:hypothetical protein
MADEDDAQARNRTLFIEAMPDPMRRRIAFDVVERNCRTRFGVREEGINAYLQIFIYVQSSIYLCSILESRRGS